MTTEQIFISYQEAQKRRVSNIVKFLISYHFTIYFDPEKRLLGEKFLENLQYEINRSQLFIIFISKQRATKGIINAELDWIQKAKIKVYTKPRIILIFLDKMTPAEIEQSVDKWLINMEITTIEYVKGNTKQAKAALLKTLNAWSTQFKVLPASIAPTTLEKYHRDGSSKRVLAEWVQASFSTSLRRGSMFIGPGTTLLEAWTYCLRDLYIAHDLPIQLFTNNGLITHNESVQRKAMRPTVPLKLVGTSYLKEYAAYQFVRPGKEFPHVDTSLFSVSGYRIEDNSLYLRVCWDELKGTFKEIFSKTKKEIVIIVASRKIIDSEGSSFINLVPLLKSTSKTKRWLTIAIDTHISQDNKAEFQEKIDQLSRILGKYKKDKHYPVIYWRVRV